ncbi:hypothetical protein QR66_05120 [Chromobacterium piscinae]|nr:hypothetical protein QR66_05120 [Chromobacterium piscinae]
MQLDKVYAQSHGMASGAKPASFAGNNDGNAFAGMLSQAARQLAGSAPTLRPPPVHDGPMNDEDIKWIMPSRQAVALHGEYVRQLLDEKMSQAGLPLSPPFQVVGTEGGKIKLAGSRADLEQIERLCNDDKELGSAICNLRTIASSVPEMDEAAAYVRAWQQARNDAGRMAVFRYYSARMSVPTKVETWLGGDAVSVTVNGELMPQLAA